MRVVLALLLLASVGGCFSEPAPTTTPQPKPTTFEPTCTDASIGLERGTKDLRGPEHTIAPLIRNLCLDLTWPQAAITCFAKMKTSELGTCVLRLGEKQRDAVLDAIGGTDQASVTVSLIRLQTLKVGIAECDSFIATVALVLGCDAMSINDRVQLGLETSDAWSLPTKNLRPDMQQRMSAVCKRSLDDLIAQTRPLGCI